MEGRGHGLTDLKEVREVLDQCVVELFAAIRNELIHRPVTTHPAVEDGRGHRLGGLVRQGRQLDEFCERACNDDDIFGIG